MGEPSTGVATPEQMLGELGAQGAEGEHWGGSEPGPGAHVGTQCLRSVLRRRPAMLRVASGSMEPPGLCLPGSAAPNTDTLQELK